jgi:hypothetical protein
MTLTHLSGPLFSIQFVVMKVAHFTICLVYNARSVVCRRHVRTLQLALTDAFLSPWYVLIRQLQYCSVACIDSHKVFLRLK